MTPAAPLPLAPLVAAARLAGRRGRVLLHSARDDDGLGRGSYLAAEPVETLVVRAGVATTLGPGGRPVARHDGDPIEAIEAFCARHGAGVGARAARGEAAGEPPAPRVLGFLGYDLGRAIERLPRGPRLGDDCPDAWLGAYDAVARWPAVPAGGPRATPGEVAGGGAGEIVGWTPAARDRLAAALAAGLDHPGPAPRLGPLRADEDGSAHTARIARLLEYIAAGDVYQVNLARRHVAPVLADGDPLALYAALAEVAPAPYGALLEADDVTVLSGSPERFLAIAGDRIETRPIKGTRRRDASAGDAADRAAAADLLAAEKDAAEHLMIVDLERNDLGRIATTGSVRVDRLGYVVELPALLHKVSRVSARLAPGAGLAAVLRATFPGGSITGAPKIRAMELIDELEPARRGPYCGALGHVGAGGLELAIAIRIAVLTAGELRVHVGGGIVGDSSPAAELAETEDKVAGWRAALARLGEVREARPRGT